MNSNHTGTPTNLVHYTSDAMKIVLILSFMYFIDPIS